MMLLLWAEPDGGGAADLLGSLPADPARAWAVIGIVALMTIGPVVKAGFDAKKANGDTLRTQAPPVLIGSATPHIDASQQLLATVVGNLEDRARMAEQKYDELERRHVDLVRAVARSELQVEVLSQRVRDLEAENHILQGRLAGRG